MKPLLLSFGGFNLFAYPLLMGLAWGIAYRVSEHFRYKLNISIKSFSLLFWGALISSWVGAKVMFLAVSGGELQSTYAQSTNFWLGGGFVFYGGLIFGSVWLIVLSKIFKQYKLSDLYFILPSLTIGHAIGRVGCFLAGCCYGTQCELPFSVHMHGQNRHPVQIYETLLLVVLSFILWKYTTLKNKKAVWLSYLGGYGLIRIITESFRGDIIRGFYGPLSTSQWVSVAMIFVAIALAIKIKKA